MSLTVKPPGCACLAPAAGKPRPSAGLRPSGRPRRPHRAAPGTRHVHQADHGRASRGSIVASCVVDLPRAWLRSAATPSPARMYATTRPQVPAAGVGHEHVRAIHRATRRRRRARARRWRRRHASRRAPGRATRRRAVDAVEQWALRALAGQSSGGRRSSRNRCRASWPEPAPGSRSVPPADAAASARVDRPVIAIVRWHFRWSGGQLRREQRGRPAGATGASAR